MHVQPGSPAALWQGNLVIITLLYAENIAHELM
jgi:hypothetical protein